MLESFRSSWDRLLGRQVNTTVVLPALNESPTIGSLISLARAGKRVGEVIVVDDGSVDDTAAIARECGARVAYSTLLGKGASMADGLREATHPFVVFLDADIAGVAEDTVDRLVKPLERGRADLVKGKFSRSQGRVTELAAKPLLRLFFPELGVFDQPLSGQMAIRRDLGRSLRLESDYGVDIGLLIDAVMGGFRVTEVDLGELEHRHHDLEVLGGMAFQITQTILQRAQFYGRIDGESLREMSSIERHIEAATEGFRRLGATERVVLLDLDGVLWKERFAEVAARRFGFAKAVTLLLDNERMNNIERAEATARLFAGVSREDLASVARDMTLSDGAVSAIVDLRRLGYKVGVISEGFLVAAEVARRRVFADFTVAFMLEYSGGRCTGKVRIPEVYRYPSGCQKHDPCKSNILYHLQERGVNPSDVVAVGDTSADACLLAQSGLGMAYQPKDEECRAAAKIVLSKPDLYQVVEYLTREKKAS